MAHTPENVLASTPQAGTPGYSSHPVPPETILLRVYMKTSRQDNPGTRVTFVSIMADPRTLVTALIALINYIITLYTLNSRRLLSFSTTRAFSQSSFRLNYSLEKLEEMRAKRQLRRPRHDEATVNHSACSQ